MKKFVIDSAAPFIVPIANWSGEAVQSAGEPLRTITSYPKGGAFSVVSPIIAPATHQSSDRINDPLDPLPTVTCANRGELTLISPLMVGAGGPEYSGKPVSVDQPTGTLMTQNHRAPASACIVQAGHGEGSGANKRRSHGVNDICGPVGTVTASGGGQSVSTAVMIQANGGFNTTHAEGMHEPMTTVTDTGSQQQLVSATLITNTTGHAPSDLAGPVPTVTTGQHHALVAANLVHMRGNCDARDVNDPLHTISAGGQHHGLVSAFMERAFGGSIGQGLEEPAPTMTAGGGGKSSLVSLTLSPEHKAGALRVAAFLISYYGTENISPCDSPAPTITTMDRLAMVTVMVKGTPYVIVDICLRMLKPAELYKAQGFPADYIISHGADGKPFTKTQQVHMCGNSVSPPPMAALVRANGPWRAEQRQARVA